MYVSGRHGEGAGVVGQGQVGLNQTGAARRMRVVDVHRHRQRAIGGDVQVARKTKVGSTLLAMAGSGPHGTAGVAVGSRQAYACLVGLQGRVGGDEAVAVGVRDDQRSISG